MGSKFCFDLEEDRGFGLDFAESCGLHSPEWKEFTSDTEAISFLEANEDKAYVFKPCGDEDKSKTQPFYHTPEAANANKQCRRYVVSIFKNLKEKRFILQERKKGVEVNTEIFFSRGVPVLAQANLECKMMLNHDLGKPTGCVGDVCWKVPVDSPLIQMSCGKMTEKLAEMKYTGFADSNVIIGDDEVWFLEFCFRPGYNAHPSFFQSISKKTFLQTMADLIDGVPVDAYPGFGGSVSLRCEMDHGGLPIYVPESNIDNVYFYDVYKDETYEEEGDYLMGDGDSDIGIVIDKAYTIENALHNAMDIAFKIKAPGIGFRTDLHKKDFPLSPQSRYEALQAMHLV